MGSERIASKLQNALCGPAKLPAHSNSISWIRALLAFYKEGVAFDIFNGDLEVFEGGVFEKVIAQCLSLNQLDLCCYRKADSLEIDFVTWLGNLILPIEVKSGLNAKALSLRDFMRQNGLKQGIVFSQNNLAVNGGGILFFPFCVTMFLGS